MKGTVLDILAVDRHGCFFQKTKEETETIYNNLTTAQKYSDSNWYFHGELQSMIGYDKGYILNVDALDMKPLYGRLNPNSLDLDISGVFDVKVQGIEEPCVGYFWQTDNIQRGLVCLVSDTESVKYAQQKYEEKAFFL